MTSSTTEAEALDLSRCFLPEALAGTASLRALDDEERRALNQLGAISYLHLFDTFETTLAEAARARAAQGADVREVLAPLLRFDAFDHNELFRSFIRAFARTARGWAADDLRATRSAAGARVSVAAPRFVTAPDVLVRTLAVASPHALLVLALHFKLVTQQHYLACVRGDDALEPRFVRVLKEHWRVECGGGPTCVASLAIQQALQNALPGRIPAALRDYRLLVSACDDVLAQQAELDVATLERIRGERLDPSRRPAVVDARASAHRKTFLTIGIVNAAFVYAMRSLGPTAPAMLAGVVTALASRR